MGHMVRNIFLAPIMRAWETLIFTRTAPSILYIEYIHCIMYNVEDVYFVLKIGIRIMESAVSTLIKF